MYLNLSQCCAEAKPGNGCVNDFSRTLSTVVWEPQIPPSAVTIFSGGTEGVLSPHVTFIVQEGDGSTDTGLVAAVGRTRDLGPHEIGSDAQAAEVSLKVTEMIADLGISIHDVRLVLVKCPLLTSEKLAVIRQSGQVPITSDTYDSMAKSRYACAVGVASALNELPPSMDISTAMAAGTVKVWSRIASCSSGAELEDCHILILASPSQSKGRLRAACGTMDDAIDARDLMHWVREIAERNGHIVQVFAKAEADPTGIIRGKRHTMNTDSDIHSTRHARAAVGGLIAGLTGDTQIYVSGGAEGQGPEGGGTLCIVYRMS